MTSSWSWNSSQRPRRNWSARMAMTSGMKIQPPEHEGGDDMVGDPTSTPGSGRTRKPTEEKSRGREPPGVEEETGDPGVLEEVCRRNHLPRKKRRKKLKQFLRERQLLPPGGKNNGVDGVEDSLIRRTRWIRDIIRRNNRLLRSIRDEEVTIGEDSTRVSRGPEAKEGSPTSLRMVGDLRHRFQRRPRLRQ